MSTKVDLTGVRRTFYGTRPGCDLSGLPITGKRQKKPAQAKLGRGTIESGDLILDLVVTSTTSAARMSAASTRGMTTASTRRAVRTPAIISAGTAFAF
jgi:hypothetical protein